MKRGFTLLELSIVIVVIGLIAGVILESTVILRNSRLNAAYTEFDFYNKAIGMFRDRYNALPGDMSNATTTFVNTSGTTLTGVTNGDGNGTIVSAYTTAPPTEMYSAWIHLRYAELIQGNFTASADWTLTPGTNIPASAALKGAGWAVLFVGYRDGADTEFYTGNYGHVMVLMRSGYTSSRNAGTLSSDDMYYLDEKYDDGLAQTGNFRSTRNVTSGTGFQSSCLSADAYTDSNEIACVPIFITGY